MLSPVTTDPLAPVVQPMAPGVEADVVRLARASRAAARAVTLYPGEHPAVAAALDVLAHTARAATASAPLQLEVLPDTVTVKGRGLSRPDSAVSDIAAVLHSHMIGRVTIYPETNADLWRRFFSLLGLSPEQARLRGGLGKLWAGEGEARIELRILDYADVLRPRIKGDLAAWEAVVSACLDGVSIAVDEALIDLLTDVLDDPATISRVVRAVEERLSSTDPQADQALVVAGLLHAVAQFVETAAPERADHVMAQLAEATVQLPVGTLARIVDARSETSRPGLARFVEGLIRHINDHSIARLVACEVRGGRGSSHRLADAFCGLAPEAGRRKAILTRAREALMPPEETAEPALAEAWRESEALLLTYSDKPFVSDSYNTELDRLHDRARGLDEDQTDPPTVISAWCETIDEHNVRLLDSILLADLIGFQQDEAGWRDIAGLALNRINLLVVVGDFHAAALLVEALRSQALNHGRQAIREAATGILDQVLGRTTMRHVASHLDTADHSVVEAAQRFCLSLGTSAVRPIAEVLSREERSRPRKHLVSILASFGTAGRQAVEQLRQSPNASVRRTAVLLLREFGGEEALPELQSLLDDSEPHVQREATRAIAMLGGDAAYQVLIRALARGTDRARVALLGILWTLPDDDAERALSYIVAHAPHRGAMWGVHARAVEWLGSHGGRTAVEALATVVTHRPYWSPFRMMALHRAAVEGLARHGTPEALAELESIAAHGPPWVRAASRARLDALAAEPA